ncbi:MAG: HAD family hydrolase [Bacillota bacterium]
MKRIPVDEVKQRVALISFDLDGVLQRNPFYMGSPQGVFGHIRRELAPYLTDPDPERAVLARIVQEHTRLMEAGQMAPAHDWDAIVSLVARELGFPNPIDVGALVEQYCRVEGLVWSYPGSHQCLDTLLEQGHTLVSITNGLRRYQEPVLRTIGLLDRFTALITPDSAGAGKPEAAIFRAAESYGSPRIHIGDVLPHDIAGAKRAGWMAIYVVQPKAPGYTEMEPELAARKPWERPGAGVEWLQHRLERDRRWHGHPHAELHECTPDAVVHSLLEIPETVAHLLSV